MAADQQSVENNNTIKMTLALPELDKTDRIVTAAAIIVTASSVAILLLTVLATTLDRGFLITPGSESGGVRIAMITEADRRMGILNIVVNTIELLGLLIGLSSYILSLCHFVTRTKCPTIVIVAGTVALLAGSALPFVLDWYARFGPSLGVFQ